MRRRAAFVIAAALLAAASPARAGLLDDLIGGLIGGGGGAGCAGGGLLDLLPGGGGEAGGCPIVESEPLIVEGMVRKQEIELVLQTAHMVTQIENMVRMRDLSGFDSAAEAAAGIRTIREALGRVERLLWEAGAVDAEFARLYPDALPPDLDAPGLAAHQGEQAALARAASRASKQAAAEAVGALESYPDRALGLAAAAKACEGQSCVLDAGLQASLFGAELASRLLALQAAHYRAVEAQLDYEQAAVERARQHALINWDGIDRYGAE
jgi:conjugal transfer/entry exclusion protein